MKAPLLKVQNHWWQFQLFQQIHVPALQASISRKEVEGGIQFFVVLFTVVDSAEPELFVSVGLFAEDEDSGLEVAHEVLRAFGINPKDLGHRQEVTW